MQTTKEINKKYPIGAEIKALMCRDLKKVEAKITHTWKFDSNVGNGYVTLGTTEHGVCMVEYYNGTLSIGEGITSEEAVYEYEYLD